MQVHASPVLTSPPGSRRFLHDKSSTLYRYFDQKVREFEATVPKAVAGKGYRDTMYIITSGTGRPPVNCGWSP